MSVSRREFLATVAATSALNAAPGSIPRRTLGRTGEQVSILAMGCGSRFLMYKEEERGLEALNRALDLGINYLDTAFSYGNGLSETRLGKVLKTRRKGIWVATKIPQRKADEAMRTIEGSLKRLQLDQIDLIHIHSLAREDDLAAIEANDGVLKLLYKLRDQKVTRFIGVTSHTDPVVLKTALERHDFDCTQMALNAAMASMIGGKATKGHEASFEKTALPAALGKKMGVTAMKIFAQEQLLGQAPPDKLLSYALSLPVAAAVVGMPKLEMIDSNVQVARSFKPLPNSEMRDLSGRLSARNKLRLERFFAAHVDA